MNDPSRPRPPGPDPVGRQRHRDRHGRGMRGPLAPPQVPLAVSRAEIFDSLVHDSADRLCRRLPQLLDVRFAVREVPRVTLDGAGLSDPVPLGEVFPAKGDAPSVIVVYRRPVELRSGDREERAALVHEVVVEQAAELLGLSPEAIDPRYGQD